MLCDFLSRFCRRNNEKGAMLVTAALGMAALMFGTAIAVDLGSFYSRSANLQNAADSAALAGASVYLQNGKTEIIPISKVKYEGDKMTFRVNGTDYEFETYGETDEADDMAREYVHDNDGNVTFDENATTTSWWMPVTATLVNGDTASYSNAYCYRVALHEDLPMHFARFFGIDSYPVDVTAMALVLPGEETAPEKDKIEEFIKVVNANIYNTVPNYYWETIVNQNESFSIKNGSDTTTKYGYGYRSAKYFTTNYESYIVDITKSETLAGDYFAYKDGNDPFCADGVTGARTANLTQLEYTLNSELIRKKASTSEEITGLFLDRPNVHSNSTVRATVLNITGESLSDYNDVPLFMRFESEPVKVGSSMTYVQPITINVNDYQEKPLVIAYDGPDPNRTTTDAPNVDTSSGAYGGSQSTATTQSAPYTINLNDADFNGVIYAPYSKVTITGTGKITGFIMAAEIDDQTTNSGSRKSFTSSEIELPTWGATPRNNNTRFDYTVKNVTNTYTVVYDDFHNYTMPTT